MITHIKRIVKKIINNPTLTKWEKKVLDKFESLTKEEKQVAPAAKPAEGEPVITGDKQ